MVTANDGAISELTAYRLTALGIPFDPERFPVPLTEADLENADLVIAVKEAEHRAMMQEQFPEWRIASSIGQWTTWTAPPPTSRCLCARPASRLSSIDLPPSMRGGNGPQILLKTFPRSPASLLLIDA
jgi:hypothetical protein